MTALELIYAGGNRQLPNISLLLRYANLAKSFKCCGRKNGSYITRYTGVNMESDDCNRLSGCSADQ